MLKVNSLKFFRNSFFLFVDKIENISIIHKLLSSRKGFVL